MKACETCVAAVLLMTATVGGQFVDAGPELRLNGYVYAVEVGDGGEIYLGGVFNEFNGDRGDGRGLLRLTSGGSKHPVWDIIDIPGVSDLQIIGSYLYVAGSFSSVLTASQGRISQPRLLRIALSGANEGKVDTTWTPEVNGPVTLLESDGSNLYLAGNFGVVNGAGRNRMAKILTGDTADPDQVSSFNPNPTNDVQDMESFGGWLYVGGDFTRIGGLTNNYLARLSVSGSADSLWTPEVNRPVSQIEGGGSHVYIGGDFTRVEGAPHRSVGRYESGLGAAVFDAGWNPDPDGEVSSMALAGGSLYAGGVFTEFGEHGGTPVERRFMAKLALYDGAVDTSFNPAPNGAILDLHTYSGGVLAGGRFNTTAGAGSAGFAVFSSGTGSALASPSGKVTTEGVVFAMQPVSGGMVIGGLFDSVGGVARTSIAKFDNNGRLDTGFAPRLVGFNRVVNDLKLDGPTLYLCGDFLTVDGAETRHVARVGASSGAVDLSWSVKPTSPIQCVETDGSYVYLGSDGLRFIDEEPERFEVGNVVRVQKTDGIADRGWRPFVTFNGDPATASVQDMVRTGGQLIICGEFTFVARVEPNTPYQRVGVAALSTSGWGEPAGGWGTVFQDINSNVATLRDLLLHDGSVYASGDFAFVNGGGHYRVAKLSASGGGFDSSFDPNPAFDDGSTFRPGTLSAVAGSGGSIYLGGSFDYINAGGGSFAFSPDVAKVDAATGELDVSWYPYPNGGVSELAFSGTNLWMTGGFTFLGNVPSGGPAVVRPVTPEYQNWASTHFTPEQQSNTDFVSPALDPDGDGVINLVESAFNMDPLDGVRMHHVPGGTSGLPLMRAEMIDGQRYATFEYTRWKAGAGVQAVPEFGSDLTGFPRSGVEVSVTDLGNGRERVRIRDSGGNLEKAFGRVRVRSVAQ